MAETKTTTKTRRTKKDQQVVVLDTQTGEPIVIRSNPSNDEVRDFVEEHTRRFDAGEPGGRYDDRPAARIFNAKRYSDEFAFVGGSDPIEEIDVSDLLSTL